MRAYPHLKSFAHFQDGAEAPPASLLNASLEPLEETKNRR